MKKLLRTVDKHVIKKVSDCAQHRFVLGENVTEGRVHMQECKYELII